LFLVLLLIFLYFWFRLKDYAGGPSAFGAVVSCRRGAMQVAWMESAGLGGWMVWNVDIDDFSGGSLCPSIHDTAYPLLTALNRASTTAGSTIPPSVFTL